MSDKKTRVFILGGGFGGLYAALQFEKRRDPRFDVTVVNRENFFFFTPMLDQHALAHSQTETGAAPWNREQLSHPEKVDKRIAA